eukprot:UN26838
MYGITKEHGERRRNREDYVDYINTFVQRVDNISSNNFISDVPPDLLSKISCEDFKDKIETTQRSANFSAKIRFFREYYWRYYGCNNHMLYKLSVQKSD